MRGTKQALAGPVFICVLTRYFTGGHRPKQQIKQQSRAEQNLLMESLYRLVIKQRLLC